MEYKEGITVIIPVFNAEKSLEFCIDSVINQTYKDWNLILVDDGSVDNSSSICDEYAVKYDNISVIHKKNGGVSSARNAGINAVKTEYIVFIDSDDYVKDDYLFSLISLKSKFPNIYNVWSTFIFIDDPCNVSKLTEPKTVIEFYTREQLIDLISLWYVHGPNCKLYSSRIINDYNIRMDEHIDLGEDLLFNIKYLDCCENSEIVVVNNKSYYYFENMGSLFRKYRREYWEIQMKLYEALFHYLSKWNSSDEQIQKYYNSKISMYIGVFENTFKSDNNDSFVQKIRFNTCVLRSKDFRETLCKSNCYINPFVKLAYKSRSYFMVYIINSLARLKKKRQIF
jgi:glycosyltransferase EpsJ